MNTSRNVHSLPLHAFSGASLLMAAGVLALSSQLSAQSSLTNGQETVAFSNNTGVTPFWNISLDANNRAFETDNGTTQSTVALPAFEDYGFFSGDGSGGGGEPVVQLLGDNTSSIINGAASVSVKDNVKFSEPGIVEIWDANSASTPPSPLSQGYGVDDAGHDASTVIKANFGDPVTVTLDVGGFPAGTIHLFLISDTDKRIRVNASLDGSSLDPILTFNDGDTNGSRVASVVSFDYAFDGSGDSTLTIDMVGRNLTDTGNAEMFFSGVAVSAIPEPAMVLTAIPMLAGCLVLMRRRRR